jgi:glycosyltransferase involved in cell wall biosynthesis
VKVAFLVNDLQLSGGIGVVVQHARRLSAEHGFDVSLVLVREQESAHWGYSQLEGLRVVSLAEARADSFDVAVATWWETTYSLFSVPAERHAYFVQSLEDRFYFADEAERLGAALTLDLPVSFITEARWIAATLGELRPEAPCYLVRNGIDKDVYRSPDSLDVRRRPPLRILVEGSPDVWFKGVGEAIASVGAMSEPKHLTLVTGERERALVDASTVDRFAGPVSSLEMAGLYAEADVVLKLSRVEGMYGPPLEGMHMGATCVTTEVTGHDEYVRHGWNALVCDWDDVRGTARALDLLARDRRLLHFLRLNAVATARGWPSWRQSGQMMALALQAIARAPAPTVGAGVAQLMGDLRSGMETHRMHLHQRAELARRVERVDRVLSVPVVARVLSARRRPWVRLLMWPVRRLARRALGR